MKNYIWVATIILSAVCTLSSCNEETTEKPTSTIENTIDQKNESNANASSNSSASHTSKVASNPLAPVPIFKNELANKLVNRLHTIQLAKSEQGNSKDLHKQEDAVLHEIESIRSLLIGEEQLMMNQYLAEIGLDLGHQH